MNKASGNEYIVSKKKPGTKLQKTGSRKQPRNKATDNSLMSNYGLNRLHKHLYSNKKTEQGIHMNMHSVPKACKETLRSLQYRQHS